MTPPVALTGIAALLSRPYKTLRLEWSSDLRLLRARMQVRPIQCYSLAAMSELQHWSLLFVAPIETHKTI